MKQAYGVWTFCASVLAATVLSGCAGAATINPQPSRYVEAAPSATTAAAPMAPADMDDKQATVFIQDYFNSLNTLQANFTQMTDGEAFTQEGVFYLQKPRQFLWRYDSPDKQKIVGTGSAMYYVNEDTHTVTQLPNNAGLTRLFTSGKLILADQGLQVSDVQTSDTQAVISLQFVAKGKVVDSNGLNKVRLTFDRNPAELRRVEAQDATGVTTTVNLNNLKHNIALDSGLFKFTPPQGKSSH